ADLCAQSPGLGSHSRRPHPVRHLSRGRKPMSLAREALADRVRAMMSPNAILREKRMFGGIAFMLNVNMLVCPLKDGSLMVGVDKDGIEEALAGGAEQMPMGASTMAGFVIVTGDGVEDDDAVSAGIERAKRFVGTLPPQWAL